MMKMPCIHQMVVLVTADTINGNSDHRDIEGMRGVASSGAEGNNSNNVDSHLGFPRQTGAFNSGGRSKQQQQQAVGSRMTTEIF